MLAGAQSVERRGCRADRSCDRTPSTSLVPRRSGRTPLVLVLYMYWYARGRMGGDSKPRPKPRPITSPDRPGLPVFQHATLKNWVGPGYEASLNHKTSLADNRGSTYKPTAYTVTLRQAHCMLWDAQWP